MATKRYMTMVWSGALLLCCVLMVHVLAACGQQARQTAAESGDNTAATHGEDVTITVFAAASLTEAYEELGNTFEAAHPGTQFLLNLAGSQQLAQQIVQGAPADVFASANTKQMDVVIDSGRVLSGTQHTFAHNRLVVVVYKESTVALQTLEDLAQPGLKLILATPETPIGGYSRATLDKASQDAAFGTTFKDNVLGNVVSYEQTVKAVLTKVLLGEGDAGIVYLSDSMTADAVDKVERVDIPEHMNMQAIYPIAAIHDSPHGAMAQEFVAYVLSPEGQAILEHHGFVPAQK